MEFSDNYLNRNILNNESGPNATRLIAITSSLNYDCEGIFSVRNDFDSSKESDKFLRLYYDYFYDFLIERCEDYEYSVGFIFTGDESYKISGCAIFILMLYYNQETRVCGLDSWYFNSRSEFSSVCEEDIPRLFLREYKVDDYLGILMNLKNSLISKYETEIFVPLDLETDKELICRFLWEISCLELSNQTFIFKFGVSRALSDIEKWEMIINRNFGCKIFSPRNLEFSGALEDGLGFLKRIEQNRFKRIN